MLIPDRFLNCHQHSTECARRAQRAADPSLEREYLELQRLWLALARNYASADGGDGATLGDQGTAPFYPHASARSRIAPANR
jgi:hypothetical protein